MKICRFSQKSADFSAYFLIFWTSISFPPGNVRMARWHHFKVLLRAQGAALALFYLCHAAWNYLVSNFGIFPNLHISGNLHIFEKSAHFWWNLHIFMIFWTSILKSPGNARVARCHHFKVLLWTHSPMLALYYVCYPAWNYLIAT